MMLFLEFSTDALHFYTLFRFSGKPCLKQNHYIHAFVHSLEAFISYTLKRQYLITVAHLFLCSPCHLFYISQLTETVMDLS